MSVTCPYCGTFEAVGGKMPGHVSFTQDGEVICPRCDMTPAEHAYRLRIMADSAAVFAEEWRDFQYQRDVDRAAS